MSRPRRTFPWLVAGVLAAASVASACSSPSPSPTPSPSAEPTPAVDIVEVFADAILDPGFTAAADITGSISIGGSDGEISGFTEFAGPDSYQRLTVSLADAGSTTEVLSVAGEAFTRTGEGPWVLLPAVAPDTTLQDQLIEALASLEDEGIEQVDGQPLHHLVPTEPIELSAEFFGLTSVEDVNGTVEFYSTALGEPAILVFSMTWTQSSLEGELELQYDFDLRATPTIEAPEDPWLSFTSDRFSYGLAYPQAWVVEEEAATDSVPAHDLFTSLPGSSGLDGEVQVFFWAEEIVSGYSASEWFAESSAFLADNFQVDVETTEPITVAGLASRYFSLHYTSEGEAIFFQEASVYRGDIAWDIDWYSTAGNEAADRAAFEMFLGTFSSQ